MCAGNDGENWAGFCAAENYHRDASRGVDAGGDVNKASGFLAGDGVGCADCEIILLSASGRCENYCGGED
jgi:hypothetical protein